MTHSALGDARPCDAHDLSIGAVILAGGRGRRMGGADKGRLAVAGTGFLERIATQLGEYGEVLLSVDDAERYAGCGLTPVVDEHPGRGPLGGLVSALAVCRSDALLALSVDMPLFESGLGGYLRAFLSPHCDAVVTEDRSGRIHPLCALYRKDVCVVFREQIESGNFRMTDALAKVRAVRAPLAHSAYADAVVANVNTPEDYFALRRRVEGPPVVAVGGVKNSGKTTLLTRVIPLLKHAGLRVGVVKHDGHDFVPDVPGTDSFRLREAGAERVAVYSARRYMTTGEWDGGSLDALLPAFADLDLVLVEGAKHSPLPKIEVVRRAVGSSAVCDPATLLALCTDTEVSTPGVPVLGLDDCEGVARIILEYWRGRGFV